MRPCQPNSCRTRCAARKHASGQPLRPCRSIGFRSNACSRMVTHRRAPAIVRHLIIRRPAKCASLLFCSSPPRSCWQVAPSIFPTTAVMAGVAAQGMVSVRQGRRKRVTVDGQGEVRRPSTHWLAGASRGRRPTLRTRYPHSQWANTQLNIAPSLGRNRTRRGSRQGPDVSWRVQNLIRM